MKAGIGIIAIVGILASGVATAAQGDGNELLTDCQNTIRALDTSKADKPYDLGYCTGLTQGVRQTMRIYNNDILAKESVCFPDGITGEQGIRIVVKYLQDHPAQLQKPAVRLIYSAYADAYPCQ